MQTVTDEDLAQLRRLVKRAQTLKVPGLGGVRTDVIAFLLARLDELGGERQSESVTKA